MLLALITLTAFAQTEIKVDAPNIVESDEQFNVTFIIEGAAARGISVGHREMILPWCGASGRLFVQRKHNQWKKDIVIPVHLHIYNRAEEDRQVHIAAGDCKGKRRDDFIRPSADRGAFRRLFVESGCICFTSKHFAAFFVL